MEVGTKNSERVRLEIDIVYSSNISPNGRNVASIVKLKPRLFVELFTVDNIFKDTVHLYCST